MILISKLKNVQKADIKFDKILNFSRNRTEAEVKKDGRSFGRFIIIYRILITFYGIIMWSLSTEYWYVRIEE